MNPQKIMVACISVFIALPAFGTTAIDDNAAKLCAVKYKLIAGSYLVNDCRMCGRPAYQINIAGSFWLQQAKPDPLFMNYLIRDLQFSSTDSSQDYIGNLTGTYRLGGEFAIVQQMVLTGAIGTGSATILSKYKLYSGMAIPSMRWPWIEIDLTQTDPNNSFEVYSIHLVAVPWPTIWYSTINGFTSDVYNAKITGGDLLSASGRIIKKNSQLSAKLGIMPSISDIGLDAVMLGRSSIVSSMPCVLKEIWFSPEFDVWSETLGLLHHGDLLSDQGRIVRRNSDLVAAFGPIPIAAQDYGLDAVTKGPGGEILFSVEHDFFSEKLGCNISNGDLLSDKGYVFKSAKDLLAGFNITWSSSNDIGLDAAYVWPHGEVWFSTCADFNDSRYGRISGGDLLSSYGRVIARNRELLAAFKPRESGDMGLDAIEVMWPNLPMDLNEDGVVDLQDFAIFGSLMGAKKQDANYNAACDLSQSADDTIDMADFNAVAGEWLVAVE